MFGSPWPLISSAPATGWPEGRPGRSCLWVGDHGADVAVVGAGLTGLWTALSLKELDPSLEVVIVEREVAAHGASGRNAGILSETIDHSHGLAIQHFGEAEARRLAALGEQNVRDLARFLVVKGIDCDYEATGRLMVALTEGHLDEARRTVETAHRLGLDSFRLLGAREMRDQLDSPRYLGGVAISGGAILDPVKLVDGLRREAERSGVRVFERSPVDRIERAGGGVRLATPGGSLRLGVRCSRPAPTPTGCSQRCCTASSPSTTTCW